MTWIHRNGFMEEGTSKKLFQYLQKAKVPEGLARIAGGFGVRRFIGYFTIARGKVLVQRIESVTLSHGGGPPSHDTADNRKLFGDVIMELHRNMSAKHAFRKGALGFVRDAEGQYSILPYFEEDIEHAKLDDLPIPKKGHPADSIEYKNLRAKSQMQVQKIQAKTNTVHQDWDQWSIANGQLTLQYTYPMFQTHVHRCQVISTFSMQSQTWTWQVEKPLQSEPIFVHHSFLFSLEGAMELGFICCAHLECDWLLIAEVEGDESGLHLLVGVWEN